MAVATDSPKDAMRVALDSTELTRDALPYTDEFERLYSRHTQVSGERLTRHQFWKKLSNAAKRGGWKGKNRGEPAPGLSLQQLDVLRSLAAGKLGRRDTLVYTSDFDEIHRRFNSTTGLTLTPHQIWRSLCNLAKKSHKPEIERLLKQAIDSLVLGIEHFNRPSECGRVASVLIMLDHSVEMLLKAALLDRGADIRNPKNGFAHSLESCLNKAANDAQIRFLSDDERRTLQVLNGLRDQAQHYLADVSEQILYTVAQGTVTLLAELLPRLFGRHLTDHLPKRVLPISINPPHDIQILMDDEYSQLKSMLSKSSDTSTLEPRLRSLFAIDRALNLQPTQVPDGELKEAATLIQQNANWDEVFKGIAQVKLSADGTGVDVAIHITKKDGIPVRLATDREDPQAVIAVRKINDTDFYCFNTTTLAKKVGLSPPKTLALIRHLGLQDDPDCFKQIVIGRSPFKMYSGNALSRLKEALPDVDMDEVWRKHRPKSKKTR
ncbi:DUF3644 domain-containing protein [Maioricimonas sp. JC845]|uniref:DUF3644 domain-containing protein n=1 Tax=Maioricimonas sp. JC845 TaxID=3232138 RepID=UPI00345847FE